jgi:hypothetical protein
MQQALAAAQAQQEVVAAAAQQQQDQAQAQQQAQVVPPAPDSLYGYGWVAPAYYGTGASWYRDTRYEGAARAATGSRMSAWHGAAPGVRRF